VSDQFPGIQPGDKVVYVYGATKRELLVTRAGRYFIHTDKDKWSRSTGLRVTRHHNSGHVARIRLPEPGELVILVEDATGFDLACVIIRRVNQYLGGSVALDIKQLRMAAAILGDEKTLTEMVSGGVT
jgi:hypothetical protein